MITAEQLIYTRVEAKYSPNRYEGYQMVYRPASLSPEEVTYIVERIRSFPEKPLDLVRLQFFLTLDERRVVLTRSQSIEPDPEIVDRNSRKGPFLAHCLILDVDAFERLECNPFAVFDQGDVFCTDARTMVDRYADNFTNSPPAELEIAVAMDVDESFAWPCGEFNKLLCLANQAGEHVRQGKAVAFHGDQDAIQIALRMLFANPDRDLRRHCTFDSALVESAFKGGTFWAIGLPRRSNTGKYLEVDADQKKVLSVIRAEPGGGLYDQWLLTVLNRESETVTAIQRRAPAIKRFAETLEGKKPYSAAPPWNHDACREIYEMFGDGLKRELRQRLQGVAPKGVAEEFASFIERAWQRGDAPWWLETPLHSRALADWVVAWIGHEQPAVKFSAWATLARTTECWPLLFWASCPDTGYLHLNWTGSPNDRSIALANMSSDEFRIALRLLGRPIAPKYFMHLKHLRVFLEALSRSFLSEAEWLALVHLVIDQKYASELAPLAVNVPHLTRQGVRQVEAILQDAEQVAEAFAQAVSSSSIPLLPPLPPVLSLS